MNNFEDARNIMIGSVRLQNYKCFEDQLLGFKALTLFSGLNGTGKSSVLQALLLLRQSFQQNLLQTTGLALNGDLIHIRYWTHRGDPRLLSILKRLYELEDYCNGWQHGPFDHTKINKATPESPDTLEVYGSERTFLCYDGEFRVFSWHIRLTPGPWRIHFFPLPEEKKLIIGYIGHHLNTVKFHH